MAVSAAARPESEWRSWRARADQELAAEYGFLSVTGLTWLDAEPRVVPGLPGRWATTDDGAQVVLSPGEELLVAGTRVARGRHPVPTVRAGETSTVWAGRVMVEVQARAEGVFVRPRDPDHPRRLGFSGTPTFAFDLRWQVTGDFTRATPGQTTALPSVMPGLVNRYRTVGQVSFRDSRLPGDFVLTESRTPGHARLIFRDGSSGISTYPAGRYVDVAVPHSGAGAVVVDFNRSRNFPCSYTDSPTCPSAPPQNVIARSVEAGVRYEPR